MKARHSSSLLIVWRLAEAEAERTGFPLLEPNHLFIALCRIVDLDLNCLLLPDHPDRDGDMQELIRETDRIGRIFRAVRWKPMKLRRELREILAETTDGPKFETGRRKRSKDSKDIFEEAEKIAEVYNSAVYPVHLLHACLRIDDGLRDQLMAKHGCPRQELLENVAKGSARSIGSQIVDPERN